jgi:hypothetical protein
LGEFRRLDLATRQIAQLNREAREIRYDPRMSPEEKTRRLEENAIKRNRISRETMKPAGHPAKRGR